MEINSTTITINPKIKNVYGFLILSCWSFLIGTISKNKKEINIEHEVTNKIYMLKRKSASAIRYKRIFMERQYSMIKYIYELLEQFFIKDNMLNISGLIIAGPKNSIERFLKYKNHKLILNKYISTIIELENDDDKLPFDEAISKSMINDNL